MFVSENGTPISPSNLRRVIGRLGQEAGIEIIGLDGQPRKLNPYDLRHSATTLMAGAGLPADQLADLLGHKDTRMVFAHYRHRDSLTVNTALQYWQSASG